MGQDASFASMATALGRYQHKLYLAIGSRWNLKVQQAMAQIGVDRVVVRFHVNADGSISELDIIQGNPNSMLGMISGEAIQQSSNLIGPFPADLKTEMPNGFPWQLAFRIY
jgi:outer membrane biosynthesis protein TonB